MLCVVSGMLIWPLFVAHRPAPAPRESTGRSRHSTWPGSGTRALIGGGNGSWLLRLPGNESFRVQLREWDVAIPGLPEPLDGLRIVQLSDLHLAPCFERRFFERVIDACRGWDADLVVMTGDIVEDDEAIGWIEPLLAPLEARLGKFAILGNHDDEHQPRSDRHRARPRRVRNAGRALDDARPRRSDDRNRRHVRPLGAGHCRPPTCRRPTSASS